MPAADSGIAIVLTAAGSPEEAERIARALVAERLAACVNIVGGTVSLYRWRGDVSRDEEMLLLIKTTRERFAEVRRRIRELHSYQLPEAVLLPVLDADPEYAAWVQECVAEDRTH
jgi:periplasmic divalent cation tolerance protein